MDNKHAKLFFDAISNMETEDGLLAILEKRDNKLKQYKVLQDPFRQGFLLAQDLVKEWANKNYPVSSQPNLSVEENQEGETWQEYRKTATVKAKLFEKGDEDGMLHPDGMLGAMEDAKYGINSVPKLVPYVSTLENQWHKGEFGKQYVCIGINGERWLVDKDIFEKTYEPIIK